MMSAILTEDGLRSNVKVKARGEEIAFGLATLQVKADIYRVIIVGKQVGAYGVSDNALKEAQKAITKGHD